MISESRRRFLRYGAASAGMTVGSTMFPGLIQQALAAPAYNATGTLADVGHVVIFMQENRAFDHYFGSLAGVRGFDDPRAVTLPSGLPVWYQPDGKGGYVLPFHFDAKNTSALQVGTDHSWKGSQQAWQGWDAWVPKKTPQAMGYFTRADLPFYYALADAFTICDAYHSSVFGATDPNRLYSLSGTNRGWFGAMGSLYNIDSAGYYNNDPKYDNISAAVTAGAPNWRTYAEVLESSGVSWKVYQEWDNYGDNYLAYFRNFRVNADGSRLSTSSPLYQKGRVLAPGSTEANARGTRADWLVASFADDVRNRRLPQVSWICAPNDYTEHPSNSPNAGENLSARLLAALVAEPEVWSKTVFLIMYDENDGFFDHVPPAIPPLDASMGRSTLAELGAYEQYGGVPVGLGPRVPMLVVSPWSKGGRVCSQLFDHTSKLRFLEEWLVAQGKSRAAVRCEHISPWRRTVCGDLTSAFDFKTPDQAWPASVPKTTTYQLVTGKPYPQPPAVQTLPRQEPYPVGQGPRPACRLPYLVQVQARVNASRQLEVGFINGGQAGAAFSVYSRVRSGGPWYYAVEAGKSIDKEVWNWSGNSYHLCAYGPNGFMREWRGNLASAARPEVQASYDAANGRLVLTLSNGGSATCRFTLADQGYAAAGGSFGMPAGGSYSVAAGQSLQVSWSVANTYGWYDVAVSVDADAEFLRRLAGFIDLGGVCRTDPMIGTNRGQVVQQPLKAGRSCLARGEALAFTYAAPAGKSDPQNWIGLYPAGSTPASGNASLQWRYTRAPAAARASTAASWRSATMPPGICTATATRCSAGRWPSR
ncbi:phosphocholine-specific phospholipase C [Chitinimonas koreensis]|uniref:phosphocholine-specific phospholipase C n=1 Tax=Chitinimonas koreensis TaxID=356302 RepID=UPI00223F6369|nr:phospholipase C, phosphocholine-specific [Chitinimonas koreensis]